MKIPLRCVACFMFATVAGQAQLVTPETVDWQQVRAAQPEGLSLAIELPKDSYHQGEVIDATLTFSNASSQPYRLWGGNYDRSGRIPDIAFYAFDAGGNPVADPLRWYFERGGVGGGLGNSQDLGEWKITLPANQWLRFEEPGVYTLRAYSNRIEKGDRGDNRIDRRGHPAREAPVSDSKGCSPDRQCSPPDASSETDPGTGSVLSGTALARVSPETWAVVDRTVGALAKCPNSSGPSARFKPLPAVVEAAKQIRGFAVVRTLGAVQWCSLAACGGGRFYPPIGPPGICSAGSL